MDKKFLKEFVDQYSLILLNWAKGKTSSGEQAEELVQNVWLQFFHAVKVEEEKGYTIQKPENFLWKIAHYVWCSFLSAKNSQKNNSVSLDDSDFQLSSPVSISDYLEKQQEDEENENLIAYMRQKIMQLNYLQREILISFYIDGKSQKEIAEKLNVSVSTIKWHLFDTRIKLKEEITMEKSNTKSEDFIYRPKHLHLAINGEWAADLDINKINESLSKQNICIACYHKAKNLNQLNQLLGIPKPYLEDDLRWLVEKEFLTETKGLYQTNFSISTFQNEQDIFGLYLKHRNEISDVMISELMKAEEKIKACGFYGSDLPMEKLLWSLIYFSCSDFTPVGEEVERPIHSDGGKYFALGFDTTEDENLKINLDTKSWAFNGPMSSGFDDVGGFWWFGLYNFGTSEIIDITMQKFKKENLPLSKMLLDILNTYDGKTFDFSVGALNADKKETLAILVKKGFVKIENEKAFPTFCVFNQNQIEQITPVFKTIEEKLQKPLNALKEDFSEYYEKNIPQHLKYMKSVFINQAFVNLVWITTLLAFNDKMLYIPATKEEGQFLTLMFVHK